MTKGLKADLEALVLALDGIVSPVLRTLLSSILNHIDDMSRRVEALDAFVAEQMQEVSAAIDALCQIPGISTTGAQIIIAEIGTEMSRFPGAAHLCSWAGVAPAIGRAQANEVAGRQIGAIRRSNQLWQTVLNRSRAPTRFSLRNTSDYRPDGVKTAPALRLRTPCSSLFTMFSKVQTIRSSVRTITIVSTDRKSVV